MATQSLSGLQGKHDKQWKFPNTVPLYFHELKLKQPADSNSTQNLEISITAVESFRKGPRIFPVTHRRFPSWCLDGASKTKGASLLHYMALSIKANGTMRSQLTSDEADLTPGKFPVHGCTNSKALAPVCTSPKQTLRQDPKIKQRNTKTNIKPPEKPPSNNS